MAPKQFEMEGLKKKREGGWKSSGGGQVEEQPYCERKLESHPREFRRRLKKEKDEESISLSCLKLTTDGKYLDMAVSETHN